jgi:hypothetical protein
VVHQVLAACGVDNLGAAPENARGSAG